jgi:hypothetical protein
MKYTIEQIRDAFKETFHNARELWFGGEEDDFAFDWMDFQDNLNRLTKRAADLPKLCALCDNPTNNALCQSCSDRVTANH